MRIDITASEQRKIEALKTQDLWLQNLITADFNQIDDFVDNQIVDLFSVRTALKVILKVLLYLLRKK